MEILRFLEGIRTPVLDTIMGIVTFLGDEYVYLAAVLVLLWCVDKKWGYRLYVFGMIGTTLNQLLKAVFLVPRPWVTDPSFTIVESAREGASGYSFPSGHTQSATVLFQTLEERVNEKRHKRRNFSIYLVLILLTAFSRMYLGVHTPLDVGVSLIIGVLSVMLFIPMMNKAEKSKGGVTAVSIAVLAFAVAFLIYILQSIPGEKNIAEFDEHALKNAYTLVGTTAGMMAAWQLDIRWVKYETKAAWWAQALKVALGLGIVLLIQNVLKEPLYSLTNGHYFADTVRYFLIALVGAGIWPMTFRLFPRPRKKKTA